MIDPSLLTVAAEEDRDSPRGSAYASKKDIKWMLIGVGGLLLLLYPAYLYMLGISNVHVCASNLNAMYQAVSLYAQDNEGRFPPIAEEADPRTGAPLMANGRLSTWMSQAFRYQPKESIYRCPAAADDELVPSEGRVENPTTHQMETRTILSSYGMYRPYGGAVSTNIERSSQTVIIAETSNRGAQGSYDPHPFLSPEGQPLPYDGFSIGWSGGNVSPTELLAKEPDKSSAKKDDKELAKSPDSKDDKEPPQIITRLAFRQVGAKGDLSQAYGRHQFIHGITADGNLLRLNKASMQVEMEKGRPVQASSWPVPALFGH